MSHKSEFVHDECVSECSLFNAALQNMEHVHISPELMHIYKGEKKCETK